MTDITPLSGDDLNKLVDDFEASEHNRMAMNAVTAAGIDKVAFDRAGFAFHGRIKSLAEAAREAGLKF